LFNFVKGFVEFEKRLKYLINAKATKEKPLLGFRNMHEMLEKYQSSSFSTLREKN
jgi:hypothetical protein